ncbi:methyl-accepting chemotaxis protein [Sporohalobacter salinus]|nr:methyl-accepting chemotaxis protein [Sporohalobacter salinus]MBM7624111.1 methyl-accepting chemotaxis protein [Sporohalobacter salinus]
MLALNASVEAARAGEYRAVVVNEIKELAEETSHATEKVAELVRRT